MNKKDLIDFMQGFTDEIKITNQAGVPLTPEYKTDITGEGYVVLMVDYKALSTFNAPIWREK